MVNPNYILLYKHLEDSVVISTKHVKPSILTFSWIYCMFMTNSF